MNINVNTNDLAKMLPIFFGVLIALAVICIIFFVVVKNKDNSKAQITKKGRVVEKTLSQGNIEWYIIEFDDGTRMKLRNMKANTMLMSKGDEGYITYGGQTIYSFSRK